MDKKNSVEITEITDSDSNDLMVKGDGTGVTVENNHYDVSEPDDEIQWVEESSESEPECDNDFWDDDCVTIRNRPRRNAIQGYHLMPTCAQEHEVPPMKKLKVPEKPILNRNLKKREFIKSFKNKWTENLELNLETVELMTNPFKFCIADDFIEDTIVLDEIRKEINELDWNKRNMDLYEFFQTEDLVGVKDKYIKYLYDFLKRDIKDWIQQLTGLDLYKISATCSVYTDTDYLLIHDDLQEDRAIAFVLYLTDPIPGSNEELWKSSMGGLLELFGNDEKGHPTLPVRNILPKNNRFIFFKVSNESYHQVSEVMNMDHCRISINGWFHTKKPEKFKAPILVPPKAGLFSFKNLSPQAAEILLGEWINSEYLKTDIKKQIQHHIEGESEISLNAFFVEEKFNGLCEVLKNDDLIWDKVGPPNRRNYEVISNKIMPNIVTEMLLLFQSKKMFSLLHEYTDLDLDVDLKSNIRPSMRFELQRWKPGSYALFTEYEWEKENELDLIMYLGNPENLNVVGGQTMYVSVNEKIEDALVTLQPKANSLNIVFRDTARIVKYVSKRSCSEYFYTIVCSYKE